MGDQVLTAEQRSVVERPSSGGDTLFIEGPSGAGKSTALMERLLHLMSGKVRGESILVLVPERGRRTAIEEMIKRAGVAAHGQPTITTYFGLAHQMVSLFWPWVSTQAGFAGPAKEPTFLNYETSQYLMQIVARPLVERGYFGGLRIRRRQLMSQLLDNLNHCAMNGFPHTEIGERLIRADTNAANSIYYSQAQECASRFRQECFERNVVDVSLTVELFQQRLVPEPMFWTYFSRQFAHVVVDNVEETVPAAQDLIRRMLEGCESATLVYDLGGGYRILLGTDPDRARRLREGCRQVIQMTDNLAGNRDMRGLSRLVAVQLGQPAPAANGFAPVAAMAEMKQTRFRSEMIAWAVGRIQELIEDGVKPADIAIIAPAIDSVLQFEFREALESRGIPFAFARRWFSFKDDAAVRSLLTMAKLAHPGWERTPVPHDVAEALGTMIPELDPARAKLLTTEVYSPAEGALLEPGQMDGRARERVGFAAIDAYGKLLIWLSDYRAAEPMVLDRFLARLFDELLSRPGFWHTEYPNAATATARLIRSARNFRLAAPAITGLDQESPDLGKHYLEMIDQDVVAAQYVEPVPSEDDSHLLIAPVYTYLLDNRYSDYQFWVDIGSQAWWRPPHQPLTNPIVLSERWHPGEVWDESKDYQLRNWQLARIVNGLAARCRRQVLVCGSDVDSLGHVQDGQLYPALLSVFESEGARW